MSSVNLPLMASTSQVAELLGKQANLALVAVCSEKVFEQGHIPGSILIEPAELVSGLKPAVGALPDNRQLARLASKLQLDKRPHLIVYDDEGGGWAGRLIWTLDVLDYSRYSYMDGGLVAWTADQLQLETGSGPLQPGDDGTDISLNFSPRVSLDEVRDSLEDDESQIWDARAEDEYDGSKSFAEKAGHIPGARNLDWLDLMDRDNGLRLKPMTDISALLDRAGIALDKRTITHCQTHHRSGLSYLVGKQLGMDIVAYDGSWSEWGNHPETPVER